MFSSKQRSHEISLSQGDAPSHAPDIGNANAAAKSFEVLHGLCHAFGSAVTLDEAIESTHKWIDAVLDETPQSLRIAIPDRSRRLKIIYSVGTGSHNEDSG